MSKTRVMLADDHALVRTGLRAVLERKPDWEVCGEASTGREAVAAAAKLKPDIVIMDISMPDLNGLEATRQILHDNPSHGGSHFVDARIRADCPRCIGFGSAWLRYEGRQR